MSEIADHPRGLSLVGALALLATGLGCGGSVPDLVAAQRLTAEHQRWDASHPARYVIGICGTGYCGEEGHGERTNCFAEDTTSLDARPAP